MNKRFFTLPILCLLLASVLMTACGGTGATPTPVEDNTPGANITQADLDAARAKWDALKVQEYTMDVEYSAFAVTAGRWNLRSVNGKLEIVSHSRGGTPTTPTTTDPQMLYLLTVDGMFNNAARALQDQNNQDYPFQYRVTFDPEKGYPTFFSARSVPNSTGGGVLADADYSITVHNVTVVK